MILNKNQIQQILDIIKKRHNLFVVKTLGTGLLSDDELQELKEEYGDEAVSQVEEMHAHRQSSILAVFLELIL